MNLPLRLILAAVIAGAVLTAPLLPAAPTTPEPVVLWPAGAPGAVGDEPADKPLLYPYLPDASTQNGTAVVICPGGGYGVLATDHEGVQVARALNKMGVAAFVLTYRLAPRYRHPAPLQDAQRALRWVRANAERLHLSPKRVGIAGFSAGGHLASTAATHFDAGQSDAADPLQRLSCRPDFVVLGYPVISFQESFAHRGSARNLLGDSPTEEQLNNLSNEKQVTKDTPPAFLFHTGDDTGVPAENSLAFYQACRRAGVPAELHIYRYGPHGVGLAAGDPAATTWKDRLADWLKASGLLADVERAAIEGVVRVRGEPLRWGMITFVPADSTSQPAAFAMVSRGNFKIPAASGPVVGNCRIELHDLGAVELRPTIEDSRRIDQGKHSCVVKSALNRITVEVE